MNFYAHMVSASWQRSDASFALGAMLPDFATMLGIRLPDQASAELQDGIDFHHYSDKLFHGLDGFRREEQHAFGYWQERGLRRGPARGVAHVGVELCMDGALVGSEELDRLFLDALQSGIDAAPTCASQDERDRLLGLLRRILEFGPPQGYQDPGIVSDRLLRILTPRPLLRPTANEGELLIEHMAPLHERVTWATPGIMASLRRLL